MKFPLFPFNLSRPSLLQLTYDSFGGSCTLLSASARKGSGEHVPRFSADKFPLFLASFLPRGLISASPARTLSGNYG